MSGRNVSTQIYIVSNDEWLKKYTLGLLGYGQRFLERVRLKNGRNLS